MSRRKHWSLLAAMAMLACNGDKDEVVDDRVDPTDSVIVDDTGTVPALGPVFESVAITDAPNADTPLVRGLDVTTDVATTLSIEMVDGGRTLTFTSDTSSTTHSVQLLGFHLDTTHVLTVTATDAAGDSAVYDQPLEVVTAAVPDTFPTIELISSDPSRMEPGVVLFNVSATTGGQPLLIAVDEQGEVVWYHRASDPQHEATLISDGTMIAAEGRTAVTTKALDGTFMRGWESNLGNDDPSFTQVNTGILHHDVIELPNGNFASLGLEIVQVPNYPTDEIDPFAPTATANVAADLLIEFDAAGQIVGECSLLDILANDNTRIGYDAVNGNYWDDYFPAIPDVKDWTHGNSLHYDPASNSYLFSARHQDAVVKFKRDAGCTLEWILAPIDNWALATVPYLLRPAGPPFRQNYHQHSANFTQDGTIMMFDNANRQASPFDMVVPGPGDSRAVEFAVVEDADGVGGTFEQIWEYSLTPPVFSGSMGDAEILPVTGNVLVAYGNIDTDADETQPTARIVQVTHDAAKDVVFDLVVQPDIYNTPQGTIYGKRTVYRAEVIDLFGQ